MSGSGSRVSQSDDPASGSAHLGSVSASWQQLPGPVRVAVGVVLVQALALTALAVWVLVDALSVGTSRLPRGLLIGALVLVTAAALVGAARGLTLGRPAARTPVVVIELLALPISWTIAFSADRATLGGPILVSAVAVLYCLFTPPARELFDRPPPA